MVPATYSKESADAFVLGDTAECIPGAPVDGRLLLELQSRSEHVQWVEHHAHAPCARNSGATGDTPHEAYLPSAKG